MVQDQKNLAWETESPGRPGKQQLVTDEPAPKEAHAEEFETLESAIIVAPNINPAVPKEMRDTLVWGALRIIFDTVETEEEAWEKAAEWNAQNNPPLPAKELANKTAWALKTWDHNLKKRK